MKYVHVLQGSRPSYGKIDILPSILKHTENLLIPLTEVFEVSSPTSSKVDAFHDAIVSFKSKYSSYNPKIWIDSGGYAFINGKISTANVDNLINLYVYYLSNFETDFFKIFSLDLPFNRLDTKYNSSKKSIYDKNRQSIERSLNAFSFSTSLADKFIFVMQFLHGDSYSIWNKICKNLTVGAQVKHRALGGMVGIRIGTKNVMSPFIAATFKAYIDFLAGQQANKHDSFNLHFLGIGAIYDRFAIAFLEKLISIYLAGKGVKAEFSYDTSRFSEKARKGNKTNPAYIKGKNIGLYYVPDYFFINPARLDQIYEDEFLKIAERNLTDWFEKKRVDNAAIFEPIAVHSQMQIDSILENVASDRRLMNALLNSKTAKEFEPCLDCFLANIASECDLFPQYSKDELGWVKATLFDNKNFKKCTKKNLLEVFNMNKWFISSTNPHKGIDWKMKEFNKSWFKDRDSNPSGLPKA